MARKKTETAKPAAETASERWARRIVAWGVFAILVTVSPDGRDTFRLPKDLVLRAEGILLVAIAVIGLIVGHFSLRRVPWKHPAIVLSIATLAWALVCTATTTSLPLSVISLWTIIPAVVAFVAAFLVARARSIELLTPLLAAGAINALIYLLQDFGIWNPFGFTAAYAGHNAASGLLGNANDVGNALLPVAVVASALAFTPGRRRGLHAAIAALLCVTLVMSAAVAATGALFAALVALSIVYDWKKTLPAVAALGVVAVCGIAFWLPLNLRYHNTISAVEHKRFDELLSGRLGAWASAARMFRDHPLTGIGPGTFGWHYYAYKVALTEERPDQYLQTPASRFNFDEAHCDHLEVLAETGVPGYAIFLASLGVLGLGSLRRRAKEADDDPRARFVRLASLPLAASLFVVAIAQYPLQLASSLAANLFAIALCAAWSIPPGDAATAPDEGGEE